MATGLVSVAGSARHAGLHARQVGLTPRRAPCQNQVQRLEAGERSKPPTRPSAVAQWAVRVTVGVRPVRLPVFTIVELVGEPTLNVAGASKSTLPIAAT